MASKKTNKPAQLSYKYPDGKTILEDSYKVPGYNKASYRILIKRAPEKIEIMDDPAYQESGFILKSSYAIHEVTFCSRTLENDPHAEFYFGKITCPFIDELVIDYEYRTKNKQRLNEDNPMRIIDPLRTDGIVKEHPFSKALFYEVATKLKQVFDSAKQKEVEKIKKIENRQTTKRLKKLANEAGKFLKYKLGELDEELPIDTSGLPAGGIRIIPPGAKILVGEEKTFSVIAKPISNQAEKFITISTSSKNIFISSQSLELLQRDKTKIGNTFSIKGLGITTSAVVNLKWGDISEQAEISVISEKQQRELLENLEFEKPKYNIKERREKTILLVAKFPEFISKETVAHITSNNPDIVVLGHNPLIKFDLNKNLAIAEVKILGKKLHAKGIITATVNGESTEASIKVVQKEERGIQIEIKVVNEDLGDQRAVWDKNLLKIAGMHPSIKRYLGKFDDKPPFPGQDSLHFRMLLAELVAGNIARKILELESIRNKEKYAEFDVTRFYRQHRKYINEFLEIAHKIQLPSSEIVI